MNQSTIPHTEISLRLTICAEFLLDEEKPIEELYKSWMRKIGGQLIGFTEFEYWYRRFKNNQFDLGHDKSLDSMEISKVQNTMIPEASGVEKHSTVIMEKKVPMNIVEKHMEDLKLNYQFNEKDVPEIFQNLVNERMDTMKEIEIEVHEQFCFLNFDETKVLLERKGNDWIICYKIIDKTIKTDDPEKSIIDHLWFGLKNPEIKLEFLRIDRCKLPCSGLSSEEFERDRSQKLNVEKLNTLLQSMFNSFDHQIQTSVLRSNYSNENSFLSMLKHVKPTTLKRIEFGILWKEEGNYQKMKEIVGADQWKQAKEIFSFGVTPLNLDDLFHYEVFSLRVDRITPEDVLRATEHVLYSPSYKRCSLSSDSKDYDMDAIIDFLQSKIDGSRITSLEQTSIPDKFRLENVNYAKSVYLTRLRTLSWSSITIHLF